MIVWLIVLGILAVLIGIVVTTRNLQNRADKKVADTASWLETEATIQDGAIERIDKYTSYPNFAFSYTVRDEYFSGRFFLKADEEQSDELIKTLRNRRFPVQYDPGNPSDWYIAEAKIDGCEVLQNTGTYGSGADESIDLHLN